MHLFGIFHESSWKAPVVEHPAGDHSSRSVHVSCQGKRNCQVEGCCCQREAGVEDGTDGTRRDSWWFMGPTGFLPISNKDGSRVWSNMVWVSQKVTLEYYLRAILRVDWRCLAPADQLLFSVADWTSLFFESRLLTARPVSYLDKVTVTRRSCRATKLLMIGWCAHIPPASWYTFQQPSGYGSKLWTMKTT